MTSDYVKFVEFLNKNSGIVEKKAKKQGTECPSLVSVCDYSADESVT